MCLALSRGKVNAWKTISAHGCDRTTKCSIRERVSKAKKENEEKERKKEWVRVRETGKERERERAEIVKDSERYVEKVGESKKEWERKKRERKSYVSFENNLANYTTTQLTADKKNKL